MARKLLVHCMASFLVESFLNVFATLGHDLFLLAVSFPGRCVIDSWGVHFAPEKNIMTLSLWYEDILLLASAWGNHEFSVVAKVGKTLKFLRMEPLKAFCLKVKFHLRKGTYKSKYTASFFQLFASFQSTVYSEHLSYFLRSLIFFLVSDQLERSLFSLKNEFLVIVHTFVNDLKQVNF